MDRFLIAPFKSGLKTDVVPFAMPEDSFQTLSNMFIHDGAIRRRPAEAWRLGALGARAKIKIGTTNALGNLAPTVIPGNASIGQQFSVGATLFTVWQANGDMKVAPAGATGTFNTATGSVTIADANAETDVFFYPSTLITGFATYESETLEYFTFDEQFAYKYTGGDEYSLVPGFANLFSSSEDYKIRYENFQGAVSGQPTMFVTNNNDHIRTYSTADPLFNDFIPTTRADANYSIRRCKDIIGFQGRLLLFSTVEHEGAAVDVTHYNRVRYSEYGATSNADSWYEPPATNEKGGFIDLPAGEEITTVNILNGRLIIFTRTAIYELSPTGNYIEPFQLYLLDGTFGNVSQSSVEFNGNILFANDFGIHIFDGQSVATISKDLGDTYERYVYNTGMIHKDPRLKLIYISASSSRTYTTPNRIVVYNYENNTFSIFVTICSALGSRNIYSAILPDLNTRIYTVLGNQKGYIPIFNEKKYKNDGSLNIIDVTRTTPTTLSLTIYNHLLEEGDYIRVEGSTLANLNGSYEIIAATANKIAISNDTVVLGDYLGGAIAARIDLINVKTKEFNFYMKQGLGTSITKVSFNVNKTDNEGKYFVILEQNGASLGLPAISIGESILETSAYALKPQEELQTRIWHTVYNQMKAESVSISMGFNNNVLLDETAPYQELTINAIMLYAEPAMIF